MFTLQAAQLNAELIDAGMDQRLADILTTAIGNCSQPVEHRGPATFGGPDPPNSNLPNSLLNGQITQQYALNLADGSTANFQGDSYFSGDVYNVDNSVTNQDNSVVNNNTTEVYNGGSVTYEGAPITINGGGITIDGTDYCWDEVDVVTGITPSTQPLNVVNSVSLQATVVTSVTLQGSVVTDVDIDTDTCEITVTKESQSSSTGAQSSTASGIMYVDDVDADTTPINVPTDCPP